MYMLIYHITCIRINIGLCIIKDVQQNFGIRPAENVSLRYHLTLVYLIAFIEHYHNCFYLVS